MSKAILNKKFIKQDIFKLLYSIKKQHIFLDFYLVYT